MKTMLLRIKKPPRKRMGLSGILTVGYIGSKSQVLSLIEIALYCLEVQWCVEDSLKSPLGSSRDFFGGCLRGLSWVVYYGTKTPQVKSVASLWIKSVMYAKRASAGNKKRQRHSLLMFYELPSLPSTGSRLDWFRTSLGCEPRSLIRVSLSWFDNSIVWEMAIQLGLIRQ
jgi:hypothetical protein